MASKFTGRDYSSLREEIIDFLRQRLPKDWDYNNRPSAQKLPAGEPVPRCCREHSSYAAVALAFFPQSLQ